MKIAYTPRAVADIEAIADERLARSPASASRLRSAILRALETLAAFPHAGRRQTVEGVRKIGVPRYPYLIYYMVDEVAMEVIILTVRHGAQRRAFDDA